MKLTLICPFCKKPAEIQSELTLGDKITYVYRCGHIEIKDKLDPPPTIPSVNGDSFKSIDGLKECYDFQRDGIKFAEQTQLKCQIADAMGLGKTIQAGVTLKRNYSVMSPCLIIVKGATIFQWAREFQTWVNNKPLAVMPVINRANLIPGFENYIISMDLISRKGILEAISLLGIKSVIIDESHSFKDPEAARTKALIKLIKSNRAMKVIALSGTPIKNRADEYFTILNILAPEYFHSKIQFQRNWLTQDEKGRYSRIAPWRLDAFRNLISKWVIRREKHEVLTNLPPLRKNYEFIEIEDPEIKKSYNAQLDLFSNFLNNTAKITSTDILGWLAKLRALTGQAKCQAALDWATEFLDSTDENLAIGIQHKSVRDTLYYVMQGGGYEPLKFSGEDNQYRKDEVIRRFENGDNRLLIINEIAGGYGLNLQCCANALVLERQWNAADEEQFEGRFHRDGQKHAVNVTYMLAAGTIDEFFHETVERKRKIFGETVQGWSFTDDIETLRELSERVIQGKLK